jgi:molybdate transport system ATP-binding protein
MSVLEFDCRFAYSTGFALDFQFTADEGITALVGPSGSGKTTVLNLVAGLLAPSSGRIRVRDEVLYNAKLRVNLPPEERGLGYVFQDFLLFPHLTVAENLRYGQSRSKRRGMDFDAIVSILGLAELLGRYPVSLSGGQKQRVALGRALLRNPRLLLLDEPLNALDRELRETVAQYVEQVVAEFKLPALLVSHDLANVEALASTVVTIKH